MEQMNPVQFVPFQFAKFLCDTCIYYCSNCIVIKSRTFKVKMYNCQSIENQNDFLLEILTTDQMQMDFLAKDLDTMNKAGKYCTGGKETQV